MSIATRKKPKRRKQSRTERAAGIRLEIRLLWRTHSDREIAKETGASPTTISKYRKQLEESGEILPRLENGHSIQACLREVSIFAVEPSPENDTLYDPGSIPDLDENHFSTRPVMRNPPFDLYFLNIVVHNLTY